MQLSSFVFAPLYEGRMAVTVCGCMAFMYVEANININDRHYLPWCSRRLGEGHPDPFLGPTGVRGLLAAGLRAISGIIFIEMTAGYRRCQVLWTF